MSISLSWRLPSSGLRQISTSISAAFVVRHGAERDAAGPDRDLARNASMLSLRSFTFSAPCVANVRVLIVVTLPKSGWLTGPIE
jgi:hypothetical protein